MRKFFLSFSLILAFTAYILYSRTVGSSTPVVLVPEPDKSKTSNPTTTTPKETTPPSPVLNKGQYQYTDGSYVGKVADAYYGNVQVKATTSNGKITKVEFLDYPHDRQNSIFINSRAMPALISEAIAVQNANVDTVSGASFTSAAFRESLSSALTQAKV